MPHRQSLFWQAPAQAAVQCADLFVCKKPHAHASIALLGYIAFHNGGIFGVGLGNSTQKYLYLPEGHTDFIFPIIVEELGFIAGVLLIIGYIIMLYRILKIAKNSENFRCSILAYGSFLFILLHILVNLLGVLALIPLTGISLPLLSYGGSFTLNILIVLFIVQRVAIENAINKDKREISNI